MLPNLRIWSHFLEKSLMENFIFCAVIRLFETLAKNESIYSYMLKLIIRRLKHLLNGILSLKRFIEKLCPAYKVTISDIISAKDSVTMKNVNAYGALKHRSCRITDCI